MKTHFIFQFYFDYQSNKRFIESFYDKGWDKIERIRQLICHNLNVHHIWNARLIGVEPISLDWDDLPYYSWEKLNDENNQQTLLFLQECDFDVIINYKTSEGLEKSLPISQILSHIICHSSYHRGQINMLLGLAELEPLECNLIDYSIK